jgi:UDP-N-acetylglucosamine diphosphorylase / glucose-1-phosphate thymidylyltransferase / UDP-N-acetylgalactosamine diphosphorylase / glucosamine-1-phosphate N-acetyltransferase / galactosamine-1-phosphate N-acetyltransferase
MVNIVIPMAGEGTRFKEAGYTTPKPFIEVKGKTMLEWSLESLRVPDYRFILIARAGHIPGYEHVIERIKTQYPTIVLTIGMLTEGMASTVLEAEHLINNNTPLLIGACDQVIDIAMKDFIADAENRNLDGSLMTFYATDPKWSYTRVGDNGLVQEVREKDPISTHANAGLYYFSHSKDFVQTAREMIAQGDKSKNEFYVAPTYNYMIAIGARVGIFEIKEEFMHGLGTPEDFERFKSMLSDSV